MAWDLRGHGRSEGKRGFIRDFNDYERDLESLVAVIRRQPQSSSGPFILFGHSMGGLITLQYLENSNSTKPDAAVLSSPALGLSIEVPPIKAKIAQIAEKWLLADSIFGQRNQVRGSFTRRKNGGELRAR